MFGYQILYLTLSLSLLSFGSLQKLLHSSRKLSLQVLSFVHSFQVNVLITYSFIYKLINSQPLWAVYKSLFRICNLGKGLCQELKREHVSHGLLYLWVGFSTIDQEIPVGTAKEAGQLA